MQRHFRPDRAVANAIADVKHKNDTIDAKGGAFRSRGKWYALSYTCTAEPEHLKIEVVPLHDRQRNSGSEVGGLRPLAVAGRANDRDMAGV